MGGKLQRTALIVLLGAGDAAVNLPDAIPPDGLDGHVVGAGFGGAAFPVGAYPVTGYVQCNFAVAVTQALGTVGHVGLFQVVGNGVIGTHGDGFGPTLVVQVGGEPQIFH